MDENNNEKSGLEKYGYRSLLRERERASNQKSIIQKEWEADIAKARGEKVSTPIEEPSNENLTKVTLTKYFDERGRFLGEIRDTYPKEIHFIKRTNYNKALLEASYFIRQSNERNLEYERAVGYYMREFSEAFMSKKTVSELRNFYKKSENEKYEYHGDIIKGRERMGALYKRISGELYLKDYSEDAGKTMNRQIDGGTWLSNALPLDRHKNIWGVIHTHIDSDGDLTKRRPTSKHNSMFGDDDDEIDYNGIIITKKDIKDGNELDYTGGFPALIVTSEHLTIYGTLKMVVNKTTKKSKRLKGENVFFDEMVKNYEAQRFEPHNNPQIIPISFIQ